MIAIAEFCGLIEDTVVGKLHRLWSWAVANCPDGVADGATLRSIDRYVGVDGFATAMIAVGWLEVSDRAVSFPNWDRWNSRRARMRQSASARMRRKRATHNDESVPRKALQADSISELIAGSDLNTEPFRHAWRDWCHHRQESGRPITRGTLVRQVARLVKLGEKGAIEAIEYSIRQGYTGIVEPAQCPGDANRPGRHRSDQTYGTADIVIGENGNDD